MSAKMKAHVVELLESFQSRAKQIDLLHYKLSHPAQVSANEMIEAMSLAHGEGQGSRSGHISDKTLYIALNYQERMDSESDGEAAETVERLVALEREQETLIHCVSLLETRQAQIIQLHYMKRMPMGQVEQAIGLSAKTVRKLKGEALDHLTEMYEFLEGNQ